VCLKETFIPCNIIKAAEFNPIVKLSRQPAAGQAQQLAEILARARWGALPTKKPSAWPAGDGGGGHVS